MSQQFSQTSAITVELTGLFFISILISGLIVGTDIQIFDSYVGIAIEVCFAENQENFCQIIRERLGLLPDAQIEIGNVYWQLLGIQAVILPVGFAIFRFITIAVRRRRFTPLRIFVVLLWFLVPFALFIFGVIDVFYYVGRGLEIPPTLEWLNMVGVFEHTKSLGNDPFTVERNDLLITFGIGVGFIIGLFFIATKMYEQSRLKGMV